MKNIIVLSALYDEMLPFIKRWKLECNPKNRANWFSKIENKNISAFITGIGKKKCRNFLSNLNVNTADFIFVIGTAGGCHPECTTGDFVLPRLTFEEGQQKPLLYEPPVELYPQPLMTGRHFTSGIFLKAEDKNRLYTEQDIFSVDMEWSFILRFSTIKEIPVFYCKTIADKVVTDIPPRWLMRFNIKALPWKRMVQNIKHSPRKKIQQYKQAFKFAQCLKKSSEESVLLMEKIINQLT